MQDLLSQLIEHHSSFKSFHDNITANLIPFATFLVENNHFEALHYLFEDLGTEILLPLNEVITLLEKAVSLGNFLIIDYLIKVPWVKAFDKHSKSMPPDYFDPMFNDDYYNEYIELFRLTIENGDFKIITTVIEGIGSRFPLCYSIALLLSIEKGRLDVVKFTLGQPKMKLDAREPLLHLDRAIQYGNIPIIDAIIDFMISDRFAEDTKSLREQYVYDYVLITTYSRELPRLFKYFFNKRYPNNHIDAKEDIDLANDCRIHCTMEEINSRMIRNLLEEKRVDVNDEELNLLPSECSDGYLGIVKMLIEEFHADPRVRNDSPIKTAISHGRVDIVRYLIETNKVPLGTNKGELLALACQEGQLEVLKMFVNDFKVDVHVDEDRALVEAVSSGKYEVLECLVREYKMDVNTDKGKALEKACEKGNLEMVKCLVEKYGANVHIGENKGLIAASKNGHIDVVKYIMKKLPKGIRVG